MISAKPVNVISSVGKSADVQSAPVKTGAAADVPAAKDVAQKKTSASDPATQASTDGSQPQMFDQVLSNATAAQNPDAKPTTAKAKTAPADATTPQKAAEPASPDIALLMSLLPALPQNGPAQTTNSPLPASSDQVDSIAATAILPVGTGRAAPAPAVTSNPTLTQTSLVDAQASEAPIAITAALTNAKADVPSVLEGRVTDKVDLFASVLANVESSATTQTPILAVPTHQAPTLTAVAQALPITAPGVLDELPMTHGEWPAALGHRLLWAVGEGIQKVELSVHPQDMGPINVHIRVENDKTDIRFTAVHPLTRDALEASIPRLRDMFSQQGLNLSQAQVFSQTSQDTKGRQSDTPQPNSDARAANTVETQEPEQVQMQTVRWRRGLVDDYA